MAYRTHHSASKVKIEIDDVVKKKIRFDFKYGISRLLSILPDEHILYLDKIQVTENSPSKKQKNANGLYCGKSEGYSNPKIIICAKNLFNSIPSVVMRLVSFIPTLFLASTLYHEIGHHVQRVRHGCKKEQWENDAELYSKKMCVKYLNSFGLCKFIYKFRILFRPIIFILLLIVNKLRKYEDKKFKNSRTYKGS